MSRAITRATAGATSPAGTKQAGTKQAGTAEKIHALTSLRFFAALYVVLHHVTPNYMPWVTPQSLLGRFLEVGWLSVSFFFLLSGYILGVVYLRRGGPVPLRSFFRARFARVYPLFLLALVLDTPNLFHARLATFGLKTAVLKTSVIFAGKLLMLQAWLTQLRGIDDPNWSLSVETLFYLSFPWLGVWLWRLRGARLWAAGVAIYLAGTALNYESFRHIPGELSSHLPLLNLPIFALGILLARWQMLRGERERMDRGSIRRWAWVVFAVSLMYFGAVVYWSPSIPNLNLIAALMVPVFIGVIWAFSQPDWLPAKLMSARWLVVLGEASFGLYLFHLPIFHWMERMHASESLAIYPVFVTISIGVSVVSFFWFEAPARRWLLKRGQVRVKETLEMASDAQ